MLEERQRRYDSDLRDLKSDIRDLRSTVAELNSTAKAMRWIVSLAIPLGPAVGIGLMKLLQM